MSTVVIIPWRHTDSRRNHLQTVLRFYDSFGLPALLADDPAFPEFSVAAARNAGVRLADRIGYKTVVVNDADTLPEPEPLRQAIEDAALDSKLHLPYTVCRLLNERGGVWQTSYGSSGGVNVIRTDAWFDAGEQDTRFVGWGFEDTAFYVAVETLLGPTVRHDGVIKSLWHPTARDPESESYLNNKMLCDQYWEQYGIPDGIRTLQGR